MHSPTTLLVAAFTGLAFTLTPTAAQATVTIDCSAGPVAITSGTEDYVLAGACSHVAVNASNVTVALQGASRLTVTGANVAVSSSGTIGTLEIAGSNNVVRAARGSAAKVRGSNNRLRYARLKRLVIRGANNKAKVSAGRTAVTVRGANNVVRVHKRSRAS